MDSLTQGLLGAATTQLGFRQRIGRDASWMAFLAAMTPDLDIFVPRVMAWLGEPMDGMSATLSHRGISHSVLMAPVIALPIAAVWWWVRGAVLRRRRRRAIEADREPPRIEGFWMLYACLAAALLSHAPLDWCTSYGTQIFAPLTDRRYAIDAIGIIDIVYTPILLLTLLTCYVARKIRPPARKATLWIGWVGFLLSVGYIATGRVLHDRAIDRVLARRGGASPVRAQAYPTIGTILLWRVVLEDDRAWYVARVRFRLTGGGSDDEPKLNVVPKRRANLWVQKALQTPAAREWDRFTIGNTRAVYERPKGLHVVRLYDMRYGWPIDSTESRWWLEIAWDEEGRLLGARRRTTFRGSTRDKVIRSIWKQMWEE